MLLLLLLLLHVPLFIVTYTEQVYRDRWSRMWDFWQSRPTPQAGQPKCAKKAALIDWHLFSFLSSYKAKCSREEGTLSHSDCLLKNGVCFVALPTPPSYSSTCSRPFIGRCPGPSFRNWRGPASQPVLYGIRSQRVTGTKS